jgi:hypothetical protein
MGPSWLKFVSPISYALAVILLVDALLHGRASLYLLVLIPVFAGYSVEFAVSVLLFVIGLFTLPWFIAYLVQLWFRSARRKKEARRAAQLAR